MHLIIDGTGETNPLKWKKLFAHYPQKELL